MDPTTSDDLKEKSKKALIELIKKTSNLNELEPLLHVANNDILIPILDQFNKFLKGNQNELTNFARNGGLKKILGMRPKLKEPLLHIVEEIIGNYPIEIQNYYNPEYARMLLDKIGAEDEKVENDNNEKEEEKKEENVEENNNDKNKKGNNKKK
jgi:hypothetical protein